MLVTLVVINSELSVELVRLKVRDIFTDQGDSNLGKSEYREALPQKSTSLTMSAKTLKRPPNTDELFFRSDGFPKISKACISQRLQFNLRGNLSSLKVSAFWNSRNQ